MPDWNDDLHELVRTRHRALIGYAYLLCGNTREAEDLVQDALVKVFVPRSTPDASVSEGYVRRAILTIYLDLYRRRRRWSGIKHLVGIADREESHELEVSAHLDVAVALDKLSPRQRACVVLRYFEDLTVPQIAAALGCAEGTVKRHLFDAHAALHSLLGPLGAIDDGAEVEHETPEVGRPSPRPVVSDLGAVERFRPPPSPTSTATAKPRNP